MFMLVSIVCCLWYFLFSRSYVCFSNLFSLYFPRRSVLVEAIMYSYSYLWYNTPITRHTVLLMWVSVLFNSNVLELHFKWNVLVTFGNDYMNTLMPFVAFGIYDIPDTIWRRCDSSMWFGPQHFAPGLTYLCLQEKTSGDRSLRVCCAPQPNGGVVIWISWPTSKFRCCLLCRRIVYSVRRLVSSSNMLFGAFR